MHPVLFTVGCFSVYAYGVMVAAGFAAAAFLAYRGAEAFGLDRNRVVDVTIVALIAGIAGARALYVALNAPYYAEHPAEILNLARGGLVWYGGFVAALGAVAVCCRIAGWRVLNFLDLFVPYVALAQAFGRIGCFLNGCCYGVAVPSGTWCAVSFPGEELLRLPTQLYSALALFAIFLVLLAWQARRRFIGEVFLGYCLLYAVKRFAVEFFRGDNPKLACALTISQWISVAVFVAAAGFFTYKAVTWKKLASASK